MASSKRLYEALEHEQPTTPETHAHVWHTEHLWTSARQDKLLPALLAFHRTAPSMAKDRTVPVGGGKTRSYTTLDEIISKVKPLLAEQSLFIQQHLAGPDVVTMLLHLSGQFIASRLPFTPMQGNNTNSLQNAGGGLTYLKRYAISALLNLSSEDDDDAATTSVTVPKAYKPMLPSTKIPLSNDRIPDVIKYLNEGGTIDSVKAKYIITDEQLKTITQS